MNKGNGVDTVAWVCPTCGKETTDFPAISRRDNKTEICSQCGTYEAMLNWAKHIIEETRKSK